MNKGNLNITDLSSVAEPYLSDKTKEAFKVKAYSIFKHAHDENGQARLTHDCLFFGKKAKVSQVEPAIKFLCETINDLGNNGLIDSVLSHFIRYDLSLGFSGYLNEDGSAKEPECFVLCYILVDVETHKNILKDRNRYGVIIEGEMPS